MEGLIQMLLGFALIALVIGIILYIVEAIFLNPSILFSLHKLL